MKTRLHLSFLLSLVTAAILAIPGVSGAAGSNGGGLVDAPAAAGRLLELINADRTQAGLQPLASRQDVAAIALSFSRQMATEANVWHNQDYLSQGALQKLNAASVGENVSRTATVERAHVALMNSPHHRANILSPKFRIVGIGVVLDGSKNVYVTQDFLTPAAKRPAPAVKPGRSTRHVASPAVRPHRGKSVQRPRALPRSRSQRRR